MPTTTPEQVLESIVTGINSGDLDSLTPLYESDAAFASEPGSLAHGTPGISQALTGFISVVDHEAPAAVALATQDVRVPGRQLHGLAVGNRLKVR